ncbi:Uncharacterised protein [Klebsiella pneumoniae]|nr:Uncharacterised protein [Klebsiella pneumoniae]
MEFPGDAYQGIGNDIDDRRLDTFGRFIQQQDLW